MARLIHGVNGALQGRIGGIVGSSWNGIPYIKAAYKKRTKNISVKEKLNRQKFAMAQAWLRPLLPFVRVGFKGYSETVEGYLAAKSWLLHHCFIFEGLDMTIDPALMKVSYGSLPLPENIAVAQIETGVLQFSWDPGTRGASGSDQVMLLAYDIENKMASCTLYGQFRSTGSDTLSVFAGRNYHLYLAFSATDRSRQSDSVYLGEWKL